MDSQNQPSAPQPFLAADVCRPGSDDLDRLLDAEQADAVRGNDAARLYYDRSQALDAAIAAAFEDVPIPPAARERVLAAILADEVYETSPSAATAADVRPITTAASVVLPEQVPHYSRRRWLAACSTAAASTAAGIGLFFWWRGRQWPEFTLEDVLHEALVFHESPEFAAIKAVPVSEKAPPAEFPLSRAVAMIRTVPHWRPLSGEFLGRPGVAYDVAPPEEPRAVVYVLAAESRRKAPLIPMLPVEPMHHPVTTGGAALGAWREDSRIVVFVVEGDEHRYRRFLTAPRDIA